MATTPNLAPAITDLISVAEPGQILEIEYMKVIDEAPVTLYCAQSDLVEIIGDALYLEKICVPVGLHPYPLQTQREYSYVRDPSVERRVIALDRIIKVDLLAAYHRAIKKFSVHTQDGEEVDSL